MDVRSKNSAASPNRSPRVVSAILFVAVLSFPVLAFSETIRVGYFEHPPSCFTGPDGRPAGVFVEILDVIAAREGWRLEYQAGTWDWCLWKLNNAEIDILPSMVISSRRAKQYRFSAVTIVNNWAQIYVPDGSRIQSLLDLKGKRVATLKRGFHTDGPNGIRVLNQKFQLGCRLILEDDFAGVVLAVKEGRADAAVLNRLVMRELAGDFPIKKTGIVFAATDSRFVMPRDGSKTPELAQTLDRHLLAMQKDSQSAMYRILERYMGGKQRTVEVFQTWMINAMAALAAGAILFLAVAILFRRRLNLMTHDLRESERRLKRLIEKIQVGIVVHGKDSRILECNPIAEQMLGMSRDRLLGIDAADGYWRLVREDGTDMPLDEFPVIRVLSSKKPVLGMVLGVQRSDLSSTVWLFVSGVPEFDEHGDIQQVVNTFMDITERKRAEEALRESNEKLTALVDASPQAIIVLDPDGKVTLWNSAAETMFGWSEKEALGRTLPFVPEEKKAEHLKLRKRVLSGEGILGLEAARRCKNGAEIHVSISAVPLRSSEGAVSGIMSVTDDITDRKRAEMQLQEYSERLEEKVAERTLELEKAQAALIVKERLAVLGHFAGSVSHELRNPLAAIDSAVYFLKMKLETGDEAIQLRLAQISANIAKSTSIIQSLLNLSRMEPPKTKTIDLMDWLTETLPAAGIPDAVEVVLDVPESGVSVDIDPEQIRMALKNIIRNAVQAMDQNGVLSIWARKIGTALAEISISDTGPGIAAEHLDKVFEPLFSTKTHGIGFGLSITKMIVENHGGTLRAESPPDGGARFVVTLPAGR